MKKILVVDNDKFMLELMRDILGDKGYEITTAEDGISAVEILKTYTPDVIFVDLIMPNIDGRQLCKIIRGQDKLKDVFIVIITATALERKINIDEIGANVCIAKGPIKEIGKNVLATLDELELVASGYHSENVIGKTNVYPRGITKELLDVKSHFEVILNKMEEGVIEVNPDGKIISANPMAANLFNMPEEKLLGSIFLDLFAGNDRNQLAKIIEKKYEKSKIISKDLTVSLREKQVTMKIFPLHKKERVFVVILNDVTLAKRAEEALKRSQIELEKRVKYRTAELMASNKRLKKEIEKRKKAEEEKEKLL